MLKELKDYVTIDDSGKLVFNNEAFLSDLDRERNQASETARANTEKKLRASLEKEISEKLAKEAEMSASEKVEAQLKQLQEERIAFNKERIKHIYTSSGLFGEEEIELYSALISGDFEESSKKANSIVEARKSYNEKYEKDFMAKVQSQQPRPDGQGGAKVESEGEKYAKLHNQKKHNDIINF